jgi:glycosyltransferase involved in cell wall biosynthesis
MERPWNPVSTIGASHTRSRLGNTIYSGAMTVRIGHFLYHYPEVGGTSSAVYGLSKALSALGHDITLYCCGQQDRRSEWVTRTPENLHIVRCSPERRYPFHIPQEMLARLSHNADQIHLLVVHGIFSPWNFAVARTARRAKIPYLVSPHGLYHPALLGKHRWQKALYSRLFEKPLLHGASAVQVFDNYHIGFLSAFGFRGRIITVPNGFEPGDIPVPDGQGASLGSTGLTQLLYLGRMDMHTKGLDLLFEALAAPSLRPFLSTIRINLVGPDSLDRQALMRIADRLGVSQSVSYLGAVEAKRRWETIAACDLVVLPSRHDAFPTVALEAMAAGKPILISTETGITSWVRRGRCGFVVAPDHKSIAEGLAAALAEKHCWSEMGRAGRDLVLEHLTWTSVARTAIDAYRDVIQQASKPGG